MPALPRLSPPTSTALALLLASLVLLPSLGHKPLAPWDEAIYAEAARNLMHHNLLTPTWNGTLWFEKPPLLLWITALFYRLFGVSELTARLPSALSAVAIVALLHAWLLRTRGPLSAWLSSVILLATFGFLRVAHVGETDVLLSLGCVLALIGLCLVADDDPHGWYPFALGLSIAVMTKGAGAVVIPITAILCALLKAIPLTASFWKASALFLTLTLPWHLYMLHTFGRDFWNEYLGFHVIARSTSAIEGHTTHPWYFLWVLLVSAAPFCLLFPAALARGLRDRTLRPWAIFALVVLIFYTLVQTRLPHYIAPAYPALALLTAAYLAEKLHPRPHVFCIAFAATTILLCILSAPLTARARLNLRAAKSSSGALLHADDESITLLRHTFPQPTPGDLLLYREDPSRSIATTVFYSARHVTPTAPIPAPPSETPRYAPTQLPFASTLTPTPHLILLDKSLLLRLPPNLIYHPIASSANLEIGLISSPPI